MKVLFEDQVEDVMNLNLDESMADSVPLKSWKDIKLSDIWLPSYALKCRNPVTPKEKPTILRTLEDASPKLESFSVYVSDEDDRVKRETPRRFITNGYSDRLSSSIEPNEFFDDSLEKSDSHFANLEISATHFENGLDSGSPYEATFIHTDNPVEDVNLSRPISFDDFLKVLEKVVEKNQMATEPDEKITQENESNSANEDIYYSDDSSSDAVLQIACERLERSSDADYCPGTKKQTTPKKKKTKAAKNMGLNSFLEAHSGEEIPERRGWEEYHDYVVGEMEVKKAMATRNVLHFPSLNPDATTFVSNISKVPEEPVKVQQNNEFQVPSPPKSEITTGEDFEQYLAERENVPLLILDNIPFGITCGNIDDIFTNYGFGKIKELYLKSVENHLMAHLIMDGNSDLEKLNWIVDCMDGSQPFGESSKTKLHCYIK